MGRGASVAVSSPAPTFCSRGFDIAVAGFGTVWNDAESDDGTGVGRRQAAQDRGLKRGGVADMVVRRRGQQHGIVAIAAGVEGGNSQRRSGVAAKRFKQQGPGREPEFAQLLGRDKAILFIADDDRRADSAGRPSRLRVSCSRLSPPIKGCSCLGCFSREIGHRRVPEPPLRMTGEIILLMNSRLNGVVAENNYGLSRTRR
jgi:hypothetical protein